MKCKINVMYYKKNESRLFLNMQKKLTSYSSKKYLAQLRNVMAICKLPLQEHSPKFSSMNHCCCCRC